MAELFKKIQPYLTFFDVHRLERQGADIQSEVEELRKINKVLEEKDKTKDKALTQLSDQLITLKLECRK